MPDAERNARRYCFVHGMDPEQRVWGWVRGMWCIYPRWKWYVGAIIERA